MYVDTNHATCSYFSLFLLILFSVYVDIIHAFTHFMLILLAVHADTIHSLCPHSCKILLTIVIVKNKCSLQKLTLSLILITVTTDNNINVDIS